MSPVDVSQPIAASTDQVWAVVGDPVAMSDLTAECVGMQWVGGSTGPALGARFRGRNRSGWRRWSTTCTIVRYEAGSEIAWDVTFGPLPVARWSYRVEPGDAFGGSVVTERFEDHRGTMLRLTAPLVRGTSDADTLNRAHMEATLARVKGRAEG
jgi:Polyketide cyclase / dehydrase and lipid transport